MSTRVFPILSLIAALAFSVTAVGAVSAQTPHKAHKPRMRPMAGTGGIVNSAPRFQLRVNGGPTLGFQQLGAINSQVEPTEYIYAGNKGGINHTKQYGKTQPPTVTLKRGMDSNRTLWAWHQAVRAGHPQVRKNAVLVLYSGNKAVGEYKLINAWPKKLEISGMKSGNSATAVETVTLVCDQIQYVPLNK